MYTCVHSLKFRELTLIIPVQPGTLVAHTCKLTTEEPEIRRITV
jgi:hypothetical protein